MRGKLDERYFKIMNQKIMSLACVVLLLAFKVGVAGEAIAFFDRAIFLQEAQRAGRSFTGFIVQKDGSNYLVTCKHSIDSKIKVWSMSVPNKKYQPAAFNGIWLHHPKADLSVLINPFDSSSEPDLSKYAIQFQQLAQSVPAKLTPVVVSGYPDRLVVKPVVSPVVRQTTVSSIETVSKSDSGELIPVFFLNQFSGPGASGSPVFNYQDPKEKRPVCVGVLAGGWNNASNTGSVVTPAAYVRELISIAEQQKSDKVE